MYIYHVKKHLQNCISKKDVDNMIDLIQNYKLIGVEYSYLIVFYLLLIQVKITNYVLRAAVIIQNPFNCY